MIKTALSTWLLFTVLTVSAQIPSRQLAASRIHEPVRIDGELKERGWEMASIATQLVQNSPVPGRPEVHPTEVRVLYDDAALYIGAKLYDHADSILRQFDRRDNTSNTDFFGLFLDTYHDQLNGYGFLVTAAGVQVDMRYSSNGQDNNWNAVWDSEVKINADHWVVEMRIPYSAIRFSSQEPQIWGVNFMRQVRRNNETFFWNPVDPSVRGFLNQFGELHGLENIQSPLRLSLTPYLSSFVENRTVEGAGNRTFRGISGGADIKYGLSEAFTLDVTLVPDFRQVQSDNQVLNLSPYEVRFNENRAFFTEGTELFNKGGFFYSRRVGGKPLWHDRVDNQLPEGDTIVDNPATTRLLNATKVSGRTKDGLGVGIFNGITANTYATIRNLEGEERKLLTQPLSNYSVLVLDQSLKNNSYVSLVNTNVTRLGTAYDANVTGGLFRLGDQHNTYSLSGKAAVSQLYHPDSLGTDLGYTYRLDAGKVSGRWQYGLGHGLETDTYNPSDLGFIYRNNEISQNAYLRYNVFKPFWKLNNLYSGISTGYSTLYKPFVLGDFAVDGYINPTFRNFHEVYASIHWEPVPTYDFFEPRVKGRFYTYPINYQVSSGYSTDYRKKLALDLSGSYREFYENNRHNLSAEISPRYRVNDRFTLRYNLNWDGRFDDIGYVDKLEADSVVFGRRDVATVTNTLNSSYIFTNRMSLTLRARHYWSKAQYRQFDLLTETGKLEAKDDYNENHDVNFNAFNVDMVFSWWFAPGSEMSVVWKNAIITHEEEAMTNFYRNLQNTLQSPQTNSVTVKVIYYLDAVAVKNKLFKKKDSGDKNVIASAREAYLSAAP